MGPTYTSATTSAILHVNDSTLTNPVKITNSTELLYFMNNTSSIYALINQPITVNNSVNAFDNRVVSIFSQIDIRDM